MTSFIQSIRRLYLDLASSSSHPSSSRPTTSSNGLANYDGIKSINDLERDQIDAQVKQSLTTNLQLIRQLEAIEKGEISLPSCLVRPNLC